MILSYLEIFNDKFQFVLMSVKLWGFSYQKTCLDSKPNYIRTNCTIDTSFNYNFFQ